jgi:hypothetical protein
MAIKTEGFIYDKINDKWIEPTIEMLIGKKLIDIEKIDNGITLIFEYGFVLTFEVKPPSGIHRFTTELIKYPERDATKSI